MNFIYIYVYIHTVLLIRPLWATLVAVFSVSNRHGLYDTVLNELCSSGGGQRKN